VFEADIARKREQGLIFWRQTRCIEVLVCFWQVKGNLATYIHCVHAFVDRGMLQRFPQSVARPWRLAIEQFGCRGGAAFCEC
jgi:hypothetical protein